jgi:hypothetical protein
MNAKLVDSLAQIIQTLTDAKLSAPNKNVNRSALFQQWDSISDADAAALKAEFSQEDITFAEAILPAYSSNLQQEDYA